MSSAAVVCFRGFAATPLPQLALPCHGDPPGVAARFALALGGGIPPDEFPTAFLRHSGDALPHGRGLDPAGVSYRYEVLLRLPPRPRRRGPREGGELRVSCWRRYPGAIGWQRRCGPMAMARFQQRFLPAGLSAG